MTVTVLVRVPSLLLFLSRLNTAIVVAHVRQDWPYAGCRTRTNMRQ
jgi:hypothetical protein